MTKSQIRKLLVQLRAEQRALGTLPEQSLQIIEKLEHHPLFQQSQRVLLFHSLPDEVNTHELIEKYKFLKTIILPTVVGDELELHVYDANSQTKVGAFNITESLGAIVTDYSSIDLAIIPGVGFDLNGNRLGRGKGYYDRLLPHLRCHKIGICYPCQIVDNIPCESHDIPVDEVIY